MSGATTTLIRPGVSTRGFIAEYSGLRDWIRRSVLTNAPTAPASMVHETAGRWGTKYDHRESGLG